MFCKKSKKYSSTMNISIPIDFPMNGNWNVTAVPESGSEFDM